MPKVEFRYEDSGAQGVKANLQTTEQVAHKLGQEIAALNKKAQLEEARRGTKEYQSALEKLAQAQGKVAQQNASVSGTLNAIKAGLGIAVVNQAREMAAAISAVGGAIYDMAKSKATEDQAKQFDKFESATAEATEQIGKLFATLLVDTGLLDTLTSSIRLVSGALELAEPAIAAVAEAMSLTTLATRSLLDPMGAMEGVLQAMETEHIDVAVAIGKHHDALKRLQVGYQALEQQKITTGQTREELIEASGATSAIAAKVLSLRDAYEDAEEQAGALATQMGGYDVALKAVEQRLDNLTKGREATRKLLEVSGDDIVLHSMLTTEYQKQGEAIASLSDVMSALRFDTDATDDVTKDLTTSLKEQKVAWDEIGASIGTALDRMSGARAGLTALSEEPALAGMGAGLQGFEALRGIGAGVGASIGDQPLMQGNLDETQALAKANEEAFIGLANSFDVFGEAAHLANSELGKTGKVLGGIGLIIPELSKAFSKSGTALDKWGAAIGGMKALTAAFTDDKGKQAALMGFWEQAEAVGALARGIGGDLSGYAEAAGHQAAAVAYWAVAAKGGHGGGGGAAAGSPAPTSGTMGPDPFRTQDASPRESTNIYIETIDPGKAGESVLDAVEQYGRRGGARKISTNLMGTNQGSQEF